MNFDTIIIAGMVMAFILPALVLVDSTIPAVNVSGSSTNITQELNHTGFIITSNINSSYKSINSTLNGAGGSFKQNPTIFQSFAFIINGLGVLMSDLLQLPYIDYLSMQVIVSGLSAALPGAPAAFINLGIYLIYIFMGIRLLLMGVSMIMKYNVATG